MGLESTQLRGAHHRQVSDEITWSSLLDSAMAVLPGEIGLSNTWSGNVGKRQKIKILTHFEERSACTHSTLIYDTNTGQRECSGYFKHRYTSNITNMVTNEHRMSTYGRCTSIDV